MGLVGNTRSGGIEQVFALQADYFPILHLSMRKNGSWRAYQTEVEASRLRVVSGQSSPNPFVATVFADEGESPIARSLLALP